MASRPDQPSPPTVETSPTGIVWFRRDLRLTDNPAWDDATARHRHVLGLFIVDEVLLARAGSIRRNQLLAHLDQLDATLRQAGGSLLITGGEPATTITRLAERAEAGALYYNADVTPYARARDGRVAEAVGHSLVLRPHWGTLVHGPGQVLTGKGTLSRVFTPFYRTWERTEPIPWPTPGPGTPLAATDLALRPGSGPGAPLSLADIGAGRPEGPLFNQPGEQAAGDRLQSWLQRVDDYPQTRDRPAVDGTSTLSADLKFGTLSPRAVARAVGATTEGRRSFTRQLAWRDWWAHIIHQHPDLADRSLDPNFDTIDWKGDDEHFARWCEGQTGFPIVDAGMRQLKATGWMHNRVRMICGSFLVKDLLIDWRRGERFFRHHLVDADPAQNAGNWQWVAGTGPDAAPYFRVFNPTTQSEKFDPDGEYLRRWLPELGGLAAPAIHEPSKAKPEALERAGISLGRHYPLPIVDHARARIQTLAVYKAARTANNRS